MTHMNTMTVRKRFASVASLGLQRLLACSVRCAAPSQRAIEALANRGPAADADLPKQREGRVRS